MIDKLALARDLEAYLRRPGSSREELAARAKVDPSKVSRVLRGDFRLLSNGVRRICGAAALNPANYERSVDPSQNKVLMTALARVWDGTPEHAEALSRVIRSLTGFNRPTGFELRKFRSNP